MSVILLCLISVLAAGCGNRESTMEEQMSNKVTLTVLNAEEAREINPVNYDEKMAFEKGLIKDSVYEKGYLTLQAAYLAALNQYLEKAADLEKYQNLMAESEYDYWPNDQSVYFKAGSFGRTNILLRNTPFIERLDVEDLDILKDAVSGEEVELKPELIDMVDRSWKHVTCIMWEEGAEENPYEIVYDVDSMRGHKAMNDALVFEIGYSNGYDQNGKMMDVETLNDKYNNADRIAETMETEIAEKLNCNVKVLIKVGKYEFK